MGTIKGALDDVYAYNEFKKLIERFSIKKIIETGTYYGWSAIKLAEFGLPVQTIELSEEYFDIAKRNIKGKENIKTLLGSSPDVLMEIVRDKEEGILLFLDAHWNDYFPLRDELKVCIDKQIKPVIVIHDFYVPDQRFGYDTYNGQRIDFEYIQDLLPLIYGEFDYHYTDKIEIVDSGLIYIYPKWHQFTVGKFTLCSYPNFASYFGGDGSAVEPQTREWFASQIKKGDVVFDVGANIGLYSILFSQLTDHTYSFEPTDTYENLLLPNLKNNGITNVKTFNLAMGEKVGTFEDKIYRIWGEPPVKAKYEFTTLDEFSIIPKYLKIDVDGFDLEVLRGGKNLLLNNDVTVCVEVNHALHTRGHKELEVTEFMTEIGYRHVYTFDDENFIFKK